MHPLPKMKLKIQKKIERERNSQVLLNDICWGVLPDRTLLPFYTIPFTGEISDLQAEELISVITGYARELLFKYLAASEHSRSQCQDYLNRKKLHASIISALLAEFVDKKYIDDQRYVSLLISSLIERGKSKNGIISKLRELRLPSELWEAPLNELFDPEASRDNLHELVLKLRLRYADLPKAKQREKIVSSLYRKGFDLDDIFAAWDATGR